MAAQLDPSRGGQGGLGEGELQNDYNTWHLGFNTEHFGAPASALYSRRWPQKTEIHALGMNKSQLVMNPPLDLQFADIPDTQYNWPYVKSKGKFGVFDSIINDVGPLVDQTADEASAEGSFGYLGFFRIPSTADDATLVSFGLPQMPFNGGAIGIDAVYHRSGSGFPTSGSNTQNIVFHPKNQFIRPPSQKFFEDFIMSQSGSMVSSSVSNATTPAPNDAYRHTHASQGSFARTRLYNPVELYYRNGFLTASFMGGIHKLTSSVSVADNNYHMIGLGHDPRAKKLYLSVDNNVEAEVYTSLGSTGSFTSYVPFNYDVNLEEGTNHSAYWISSGMFENLINITPGSAKGAVVKVHKGSGSPTVAVAGEKILSLTGSTTDFGSAAAFNTAHGTNAFPAVFDAGVNDNVRWCEPAYDKVFSSVGRLTGSSDIKHRRAVFYGSKFNISLDVLKGGTSNAFGLAAPATGRDFYIMVATASLAAGEKHSEVRQTDFHQRGMYSKAYTHFTGSGNIGWKVVKKVQATDVSDNSLTHFSLDYTHISSSVPVNRNCIFRIVSLKDSTTNDDHWGFKNFKVTVLDSADNSNTHGTKYKHFKEYQKFQFGTAGSSPRAVSFSAPAANSDAPGATIKVSGNIMVIGNTITDVVLPSGATVSGAGSVDVYENVGDSGWSFKQTLTASITPDNVGSLGRSAAIIKDYIIIGAPSDDITATQCGTVRVFKKGQNNSYYEIQDPVQPPGVVAQEQFGAAIANYGNTVIVSSAERYSSDATYANGQLYEFFLNEQIDQLRFIQKFPGHAPIGTTAGNDVAFQELFGNHDFRLQAHKDVVAVSTDHMGGTGNGTSGRILFYERRNIVSKAVDAIDTTGVAASAADCSFTINIPFSCNGHNKDVTILLDASETTNPTEGSTQIGIGVSGQTDAQIAALIIKAINGITNSRIDFVSAGSGQAAGKYRISGVTGSVGSSDTQITLTMGSPSAKPEANNSFPGVLASVSGVNIIDVTDFTTTEPGPIEKFSQWHLVADFIPGDDTRTATSILTSAGGPMFYGSGMIGRRIALGENILVTTDIGHSVGNQFTGSVFVLGRDNDGQWAYTQQLQPSPGSQTNLQRAHFGEGMAISGSSLIVTAPHQQPEVFGFLNYNIASDGQYFNNTGEIYHFTQSTDSNTYTLDHKLFKPSNGHVGDTVLFGSNNQVYVPMQDRPSTGFGDEQTFLHVFKKQSATNLYDQELGTSDLLFEKEISDAGPYQLTALGPNVVVGGAQGPFFEDFAEYSFNSRKSRGKWIINQNAAGSVSGPVFYSRAIGTSTDHNTYEGYRSGSVLVKNPGAPNFHAFAEVPSGIDLNDKVLAFVSGTLSSGAVVDNPTSNLCRVATLNKTFPTPCGISYRVQSVANNPLSHDTNRYIVPHNLHAYSFSGSAIGSPPNDPADSNVWKVNGYKDSSIKFDKTHLGPRIFATSSISGYHANERALALCGYNLDHGDIDDPPLASGAYRFAEFPSTYETPLDLQFKVAKGGNAGAANYSGSFIAPASHASSHRIYAQYKTSGGTWTTIAYYNSADFDDNFFMNISTGIGSSIGNVSLRIITRQTSSFATAFTTSGTDTIKQNTGVYLVSNIIVNSRIADHDPFYSLPNTTPGFILQYSTSSSGGWKTLQETAHSDFGTQDSSYSGTTTGYGAGAIVQPHANKWTHRRAQITASLGNVYFRWVNPVNTGTSDIVKDSWLLKDIFVTNPNNYVFSKPTTALTNDQSHTRHCFKFLCKF